MSKLPINNNIVIKISLVIIDYVEIKWIISEMQENFKTFHSVNNKNDPKKKTQNQLPLKLLQLTFQFEKSPLFYTITDYHINLL